MKSITFPGMLLSIMVLFLSAMPTFASSPLQVTVSILPQAYFVQQIAGDLADISVMVQPGASPATYEPQPRQMIALSASKIYFAIGVPFETAWLEKFKAANTSMDIVKTQQNIKKVPMAQHVQESTHDHSPEIHPHGILDPHIWLSPLLVKKQAITIGNAFIRIDPKHAAVYTENLKKFTAQLTALDATITKILGHPSDEHLFMVFHPSWGYFAQAYGLIQVPIELEGKSPSPKEIVQLIHMADTTHITTIFAQPQFSKKDARVIAKAIHGQIITLDPLAQNWDTNLLSAAKAIKKSFPTK